MLTVESNKRVKRKKLQKKETVVIELRERIVRDSNQESSDLDTENHTVHK